MCNMVLTLKESGLETKVNINGFCQLCLLNAHNVQSILKAICKCSLSNGVMHRSSTTSVVAMTHRSFSAKVALECELLPIPWYAECWRYIIFKPTQNGALVAIKPSLLTLLSA